MFRQMALALLLQWRKSPLCQDSIFNTPGGIGGQAHVLIRFKGGDPFDKANSADRDQVVLVPGLSVIFFKGLLQETNPPR